MTCSHDNPFEDLDRDAAREAETFDDDFDDDFDAEFDIDDEDNDPDDHTPIGHPADCDCDECYSHEGDDVLL